MTLGEVTEKFPIGSFVDYDDNGTGEVMSYHSTDYVKQDGKPMNSTVLVDPDLTVLTFDGENYRTVLVPVDNVWRCTI